MADSGVSGQNFLRLLFGGLTGRGGLQAGVDQIPVQQGQQADLGMAIQRMLQQRSQFDQSLTQRRDLATAAMDQRGEISAAADADRDADRELRGDAKAATAAFRLKMLEGQQGAAAEKDEAKVIAAEDKKRKDFDTRVEARVQQRIKRLDKDEFENLTEDTIQGWRITDGMRIAGSLGYGDILQDLAFQQGVRARRGRTGIGPVQGPTVSGADMAKRAVESAKKGPVKAKKGKTAVQKQIDSLTIDLQNRGYDI